MAVEVAESEALVLLLPPTRGPFTDAEVVEFTRLNPDLRLEIDPDGNLIVMAPTGASSDLVGHEIAHQLSLWVDAGGTGRVFGGTAGFRLPVTHALRSPDAAWIRRSRWQSLTRQERQGFSPVCPDFVVEVRSPSDHLSDLHPKMREYMDAGAELGWLLDPETRAVWVYRAGESQPATLLNPGRVIGDPVLPGFQLQLARVWDAAEA